MNLIDSYLIDCSIQNTIPVFLIINHHAETFVIAI